MNRSPGDTVMAPPVGGGSDSLSALVQRSNALLGLSNQEPWSYYSSGPMASLDSSCGNPSTYSGNGVSARNLLPKLQRNLSQIESETERAVNARCAAWGSSKALRAAALRVLSYHDFRLSYMTLHIDAIMEHEFQRLWQQARMAITAQSTKETPDLPLQSAALSGLMFPPYGSSDDDDSANWIAYISNAQYIQHIANVSHEVMHQSKTKLAGFMKVDLFPLEGASEGTQEQKTPRTAGGNPQISVSSRGTKILSKALVFDMSLLGDFVQPQSQNTSALWSSRSMLPLLPNPVYLKTIISQASVEAEKRNSRRMSLAIFQSLQSAELDCAWLDSATKYRRLLQACFYVIDQHGSNLGASGAAPEIITRRLLEWFFRMNFLGEGPLQTTQDQAIASESDQAREEALVICARVSRLNDQGKLPNQLLDKAEVINNAPFWAAVFTCIRAGRLDAASSLIDQAKQAGNIEMNRFPGFFQCWKENDGLVNDVAMLRDLHREYSVLVRRGRDPFRRLCYVILFRLEISGRLDLLDEDYSVVMTTLEDWLWLQTVSVRSGTSADRSLVPSDLQPYIMSFALVKTRILEMGDSESTDDTYLFRSFVLMLIGEFQPAILCLLQKAHLFVYGAGNKQGPSPVPDIALLRGTRVGAAQSTPGSAFMTPSLEITSRRSSIAMKQQQPQSSVLSVVESSWAPEKKLSVGLRLLEDAAHLALAARKFNLIPEYSESWDYAEVIWKYVSIFLPYRPLDAFYYLASSLSIDDDLEDGEFSLREELIVSLLKRCREYILFLGDPTTKESVGCLSELMQKLCNYSNQDAVRFRVAAAKYLACVEKCAGDMGNAAMLYEIANEPLETMAIMCAQIAHIMLLSSGKTSRRVVNGCTSFLDRIHGTDLGTGEYIRQSLVKLLSGLNFLERCWNHMYYDAYIVLRQSDLFPWSDQELIPFIYSYQFPESKLTKEVVDVLPTLLTMGLQCMMWIHDSKTKGLNKARDAIPSQEPTLNLSIRSTLAASRQDLMDMDLLQLSTLESEIKVLIRFADETGAVARLDAGAELKELLSVRMLES